MEMLTPWTNAYGEVPKTLSYPETSMAEEVLKTAKQFPDFCAYSYYGKNTSYRVLQRQIEDCARAFLAAGIKKEDRVTICLPNLPQTVVSFYALNLIGAVVSMVHPLSSESEIAFFVQESGSVAAVTLDLLYDSFSCLSLSLLVCVSVGDGLPAVKKAGYFLKNKKKKFSEALNWNRFIASGKNYKGEVFCRRGADEPAAILYSGGTTGMTKGVLLSNRNFNAEALSTAAMSRCRFPGSRMLSVIPMFHGFGFGLGVHMLLITGGGCILLPRLKMKEFAKILCKSCPDFIIGVPTLYETMIRSPLLKNADLSRLQGVFSGGDKLSPALKAEAEQFLRAHGAQIPVREGYGATECVAASCLTPMTEEKPGSVGVPLPDTFYKIARPGEEEALPYGEEGEICISGPTVMLGYTHGANEEKTLCRHRDGRIWLRTGDLGTMDEDGFIYFRQRIKRMIVSSGYSVYPAQIESVVELSELVYASCAVGVPDPHKMQKVRLFVILAPGVPEDEATKQALFAHCKKNIAKYCMPYEIVFLKEFPKTKLGKIAYRELENF